MDLKKLFHRKKKTGKDYNIALTRTRGSVKEQLEHVFKKFDVNGVGKISASDIGSIMERMGNHPTVDELETLINDVDGDGDGYINLQEFIELNTKDIDSSEEMEILQKAFSILDFDNNGLISELELQQVLRLLYQTYTIAECQEMIASVDTDGDGMINFDEFKVMMGSLRK